MESRVILITGASSGIGAALAREWARRGANLVLAARRLDRLQALAGEIGSGGGRAVSVRCDVTRDGDPERAVVRAISEWGRLDTVVANAGFGVPGSFKRLTLDDYRRQFEVNVFGLMRTVHAAVPELVRTRGRLALIGSVSGYYSLPGASAYSMSKSAVRALAQSLRHELAASGVSVTHIAPGFVESEFRLKDGYGELKPDAHDDVPRILVMATDKAARQIVRAIEARRRETVITAHGKLLAFLARHSPALVDWVLSFQRRRRRVERRGASTSC